MCTRIMCHHIKYKVYMWHNGKLDSRKCNTYIWTIIYMYRACHVVYMIIIINIAWYFNQSLSVSHTIAVHTRARAPDEPIRIWYMGTIIRTREWPNNRRSWHHYYLYCFIMLIENLMVKKLKSGGYFSYIPGIVACNDSPWLLKTKGLPLGRTWIWCSRNMLAYTCMWWSALLFPSRRGWIWIE